MSRFGKNTGLFGCSVAFLFFILPSLVLYPSKGIAQETNADNIESIKIMTINLLFSEVDDRNKRLKSIADYVAANQIDVLLLQEVVGGELVNTDNSAEDLKDLLRDRHDLKYNERTAFAVGVKNLLEMGNAILSRFKIVSWDDHELPNVTEEEFLGFDVKMPRRVIMMRLLIPGFGEIEVFSAHLCSRCSLNDREDQFEELFDYIEKKNGARRPAVVGGDMNFDLFDNDGDERFLYDQVLDEGFSDAYADYIIAASKGQETLESLCEDEDNADEHCTVGVTDLNGPNARRIDYIFARNFGPPAYSQVVFNPDAPNGVPPTVSDHAAVVAHLPFQTVIDPGADTIDDILNFFDDSVDDGSIYGRGKKPKKARERLRKFDKKLVSVQKNLDKNKMKKACQKLRSVDRRCDDDPKPKDWIIGDEVPEISDMIYDLMLSLECGQILK